MIRSFAPSYRLSSKTVRASPSFSKIRIFGQHYESFLVMVDERNFGGNDSAAIETADADVADVIEWCARELNVQGLNTNFVKNFLIKCNFDRNVCQEALEQYITKKKTHSEYLMAGDLKHDREFRTFCTSVFSVYMPTLTSEKYRVYIDKITDDERLFDVAKIVKYFTMQTDLRFMENQRDNGDVILFDCNHVNLLHFVAFVPYFIESLTLVLQVFPLKLKLLVLVNAGKCMTLLLNVIKVLFLRETAFQFYIYSNGSENFHKHVDVGVLPSDYGGKLPNLEQIRNDCIRKLDMHDQWFTEMNYRMNFGRFQQKKVNVWGVNGSFKNLEID